MGNYRKRTNRSGEEEAGQEERSAEETENADSVSLRTELRKIVHYSRCQHLQDHHLKHLIFMSPSDTIIRTVLYITGKRYYLAVDTEQKKHQEEQEAPKRRWWQILHSLGICDERQMDAAFLSEIAHWKLPLGGTFYLGDLTKVNWPRCMGSFWGSKMEAMWPTMGNRARPAKKLVKQLPNTTINVSLESNATITHLSVVGREEEL